MVYTMMVVCGTSVEDAGDVFVHLLSAVIPWNWTDILNLYL